MAIEFDGLYWHSVEAGKSRTYHLKKTQACEDSGIHLIHIFEDEWIQRRDVVLSRLEAILGRVRNRVFAKKCEVREIDSTVAKVFLEENHLQGYVGSSISFGLYKDTELYSVMSFSRGRSHISKNYDWELTRFASVKGVLVVGGASKLFTAFIRKNSPTEVVSYADRRWSQGGLYKSLGFEYVRASEPSYWYIKSGKRYHRSTFTKHKLVDAGYDPHKTEREIMEERGFHCIYDCGTLVYRYSPQTKSV